MMNSKPKPASKFQGICNLKDLLMYTHIQGQSNIILRIYNVKTGQLYYEGIDIIDSDIINTDFNITGMSINNRILSIEVKRYDD